MLASYLLLVGLAGAFASPVLLDEQPVDSPVLLDEQSIDSPVLPDEQAIGEKIVGGWNGRIEDVPYLVSVLWNGNHNCGGTIISPYWVVSAAHCFTRPMNQYSIRAGSTNRNSGGSIHQIARIVNHASYGWPSAVSNDISCLQVRNAFWWTNQVRPANLPAQNQGVNGGTWSRISGWGALWSGGPAPTVVQIADVPIVAHQACRNALGSVVGNDMLCAGFTQGGVDACQGDSGGPLVIGGTLFGATSWGNGCARPGFPGVYASVPFFRNWIRQTTGV